jgi:hypothetical protein
LRQSVKVTRQIVDVFEGSEEMQTMQARLSDEEIARRAQGVMFDADYVDPRDLHDALLARLKSELATVASTSTTGLERALNRIMAAYPHLIRQRGAYLRGPFQGNLRYAHPCRNLSSCQRACSGRAAMSTA